MMPWLYAIAPPVIDGWDWDYELECWCLRFWSCISTADHNWPGRFASVRVRGVRYAF